MPENTYLINKDIKFVLQLQNLPNTNLEYLMSEFHLFDLEDKDTTYTLGDNRITIQSWGQYKLQSVSQTIPKEILELSNYKTNIGICII